MSKTNSNGQEKAKIFHVESFENENGQEIDVLLELDQEGESEPIYRGRGIGIVNINGRPMPQDMKFQIPANSLQEAFSAFDENGQKEIERLKKELEERLAKPQIASATQMPWPIPITTKGRAR